MKKFQKRNPSNSRIFINLKNNNLKKPNVKFEYPNKESIEKIVNKTIKEIWMIFNMLILILIFILMLLLNKISPIIQTSHNNLNNSIIQIPLILIFILSYIFLPPKLTSIFLSKNDKFLSLMPKINKQLSLFPLNKSYYKCVKKLNSKIFTIEYFDNIFLDYITTKEFKKYLKSVEIVEYKFDMIEKGLLKKRKHKQDFVWKANFYFSKIPKTGKLEVFYL